jgi:hypothetical protein
LGIFYYEVLAKCDEVGRKSLGLIEINDAGGLPRLNRSLAS